MALSLRRYLAPFQAVASDGKVAAAAPCLDALTLNGRYDGLFTGVASDGKPVVAIFACKGTANRRLGQIVGVASDGKPVYAAHCCMGDARGPVPGCHYCPSGLPRTMHLTYANAGNFPEIDGLTQAVAWTGSTTDPGWLGNSVTFVRNGTTYRATARVICLTGPNEFDLFLDFADAGSTHVAQIIPDPDRAIVPNCTGSPYVFQKTYQVQDILGGDFITPTAFVQCTLTF